MSKNVLYIIIFFLLGAVSFLLWSQFAPQPKADSNIQISPTKIIPGEDEGAGETGVDMMDEDSSVEQAESPLVLSGSLVDVREVPSRQGTIDIIVLVNDGTEVISANANALAEPGVLAPIDTLGLTVGQNVTLKGYLESGVFILTEIE